MGTTANQKKLFFNLRKVKSQIEALEDGDLRPDQVQFIAKKLGVQTYKPTPEEMKIWQSTGRAIWKEFDSKIDKTLLKLVLDAQAK